MPAMTDVLFFASCCAPNPNSTGTPCECSRATSASSCARFLMARDAGQRRRDRLRPGALGTRGVHARGVEDGELPHILTGLRVPTRRGVAEDREKIALVILAQLSEAAPDRIGRRERDGSLPNRRWRTDRSRCTPRPSGRDWPDRAAWTALGRPTPVPPRGREHEVERERA